MELIDYDMNQQSRILGHVIRAEDNDLTREPALGSDLRQREHAYKRVGRPRTKWVDQAAGNAWARLSINKHNVDYLGTKGQQTKIIEAANQRRKPFDSTKY